MKKALALLTLCAAVFVWCAPSFAATNPGEKLVRGVANIVSSPIEIAKQIDIEWKASAGQKGRNTTMAVVGGLFKGLAYTVGRIGSGAWDVVSFPFKVPDNFDPVMKPEFVLSK